MTVADLSPDALARLEAKLVADLEMVRKVRALLEEHQTALGTPSTPLPAVETPQAPAAAVAPTVVTAPVVPRKPLSEVFMDTLIATAGRPFAPLAFKQAVCKIIHNYPQDSTVKSFFTQMIRQGKLVVHEVRKGRQGSLYRSLIEPTESPAAAEDPETASLPAPQA